MILKALADHYEVLLEDEYADVPPPGFSIERVSCAAILSEQGDLVDILDLRTVNGEGKVFSRFMNVPAQVKRASNIRANFLCDNPGYVFGLDFKGNKERAMRTAQEFQKYNLEILDGVKDIKLKPLLRFLSTWEALKAKNSKVLIKHEKLLKEGGNIVFKVDGVGGYLHQVEAAKKAWMDYRQRMLDIAEKGQCLVTGEREPIAQLHPSIKNIIGGKSTGGSLVSFNKRSFESYGKKEKQGFNSPIGARMASAYTSALNYMTCIGDNHMLLGDATTVFWAERSSNGIEESIFTQLINFSDDETEDGKKSDRQVAIDVQDMVKTLLGRARKGLPILEDGLDSINSDTRFFILGLAPNEARISIRFWHVDCYESILKNLVRHQLDMDVAGSKQEVVSAGRVLKELGVNKDLKNLSPLMAGKLTEAVIRGTLYPRSLYTAVLARIRADNEVNPIRAGLVKACLLRKARIYDQKKVGELTVALNEENRNIGYMLGRLFAVIEKAQEDGIKKNTIGRKYFASAMTIPGSVFQTLSKLFRYYIEKSDYGYARDREMQNIMQSIDHFPAHLNLDDQGQFILGYYHQKQAFYTKKSEDK